MAVLTVSDLSIGYNGTPVISGLNFSVEQGEYVCIVGENGSGKSTLMRTMLALQPPLGGSIRLGDGLHRNEIGYLPQQTDVQQDFPASVWEIVLSGCANRLGARPFYGKAEKEIARANIKRLALEPLVSRCYRELSGGQQQRVLLARALSATKKLLLLDEPAAGLDPVVTAELYRLINELNKRDGIAVVMISHDLSAALEYSDRILYIGSSVFFGTKTEFLDSPAARALLAVKANEGGDSK